MFNKNKVQKIYSKILYLCLVIGLLFIIFLVLYKVSQFTIKQDVIIGDQVVKVDIPKTNEEKALGLGNRDKLPENDGMLFVYSDYTIPGFWMKDMNFPIDIIWIKDGIVMGFEKNVPTEDNDNLTVYRPKTFINYVLEVNAGFVDKHDIRIGDEAKLPF